ncbi:MAG: hypothetical protein WAT52_08080 [Chitinophagales bacterium]
MYSNYTKVISISIAIVIQTMVSAQINMLLNVSSKNIQSIDDLWDIQLNDINSNVLAIDVEVTVYNSDEEINYFGVSRNIILKNNQSINLMDDKSNLEHITINFPVNTEMQVKENKISNKLIPNGSYIICASILKSNSKIELSRECIEYIVNNTCLDSLLEAQKNKFTFQKLEPQVALQTFSYFDIGNNTNDNTFKHRNSGFYLNSKVNVFSFPVDVSFFYDTDKDFYYNSASTIQFNFDTYEYKTNLTERLKQTVKEHSGISSDLYKEVSTMMTEYENIEKMIANPMFQMESKYLDSIKVLKNYLSDSATLEFVNKQIEKYADTAYLTQLYDSLDCDSSALYQTIQNKADSLNAIKVNITKRIDKASAIIEKAKGYQSILERKEEITQLLMTDTNVAKAAEQYKKLKDIDYSQFSDPDYLKDQLSNLDQINKLESILAGVNEFQLGMTTPDYSEFSITGVLLNGININYETGKWNLITIAGKINDNSSLFSVDQFKQTYSKLYVAGVGYKFNENLEYGVYVLQSDFKDTDTLSWYNFLEENNTIANNIKADLFKKRIQLDAEFALSYAQNNDYNYVEEGSIELPTTNSYWIVEALSQNDNSEIGAFTDKASKLELATTIDSGRTKLSVATRYIGSGFYTPGNPFLLNDLLSFEAGLERNFLKNRIVTSFFILHNQDNLSGNKEITSEYYNYKVRLLFNFRKLPVISVDYLPNVIINNYEQIQVNAFSATANYSYMLFKHPCILNASIFDISTLSSADQNANYYNRIYNILQTYVLNAFNLNVGWSMNSIYTIEEVNYYQTFSLGVQYSNKNVFQISTSIQAVKENAADQLQPGCQIEIGGQVLKNLVLRAGYYMLPVNNIYFITGNENLTNQTAYFTTTFNF